MRLQIKMETNGEKLVVPYNTNHILSSLIYQKIADENLREQLHDSIKFKYFTFSKLYLHVPEFTKNVMIQPDGKVSFIFSSPNPVLADSLLDGLEENPEFNFIGTPVFISDVTYLKDRFNHSRKFKTLSPIFTSDKDDKVKTFRDPFDPDFFTQIEKTLVNKYNQFNGDNKSVDDITIFSNRADKLVSKVISLKKKDTVVYHTCFETSRRNNSKIIMKGDEDLIKFGYEAGLGNITSSGFGLLEVT